MEFVAINTKYCLGFRIKHIDKTKFSTEKIVKINSEWILFIILLTVGTVIIVCTYRRTVR